MSKISLKIKNWTTDLISIIYLLIYYRVKKKLIKFTKDDTQECSDNHVLSINLLSFSTTILTTYVNVLFFLQREFTKLNLNTF